MRDSAKDVLDAIYDTDNAPGLGGMGMSARIQGVGNPADNAASNSGWSSKIWGKGSGGDNLPTVPTAGGPLGGPMPGYGGQGQYGYPSDPNQGGYNGPQAPNAYGQQQPPYQPEYPSYGGPGGPAAPGAPAPYGGQPQFGGPPQFNEQKFSGIGNPMYQDARGACRVIPVATTLLSLMRLLLPPYSNIYRREGFLPGLERESCVEVYQVGWTTCWQHERRTTWLDESS